MPPESIRAKLVRRQDVTPDLCRLWFQVEDAETRKRAPFTFKPGQYCTLGIDGVERAYSIASAPDEALIEIFAELLPEGELTPRMWELDIGDYMSIRPRAKGVFFLNERVHHHFMLATVTGVAPYMSMIRSYVHHGGRGHKFYLILGASYMDELTYDKELGEFAKVHPDWFVFVPTVSRPDEERNAGWQGAKGRVNLIVEGCLEEFNPPKDDTLIYACGHPGMIEYVKEKFKPKGWNIKEERFWKE